MPLRAVLSRPGLFSLLIAQGDHGINTGGAAGGQITRQQACGQQRERCQNKCPGIECRNPPQLLRLQNAHGKKCDQQAEEKPAADQQDSFAKHQHQDIAGLRSQRHADAEFLRLQGDGIGHDTEQADQSETKTDCGNRYQRKSGEIAASSSHVRANKRPWCWGEKGRDSSRPR